MRPTFWLGDGWQWNDVYIAYRGVLVLLMTATAFGLGWTRKGRHFWKWQTVAAVVLLLQCLTMSVPDGDALWSAFDMFAACAFAACAFGAYRPPWRRFRSRVPLRSGDVEVGEMIVSTERRDIVFAGRITDAAGVAVDVHGLTLDDDPEEAEP